MNTEKIVIGFLTLVVLGMSYVIFTGNQVVPSEIAGHAGIDYVGMVCPKVTRADGTVEELECKSNYLTYNGTNHTTSQLFSKPTAASATDIVDTLVLGNTTGNFEQPEHPGNITDCGLTQVKPLVWSSVAGQSGNVSNATTWTSTCTLVVNTTGLETNAGMYFAGNNFSSSVSLQPNDQLTVTLYVWVT